MTKGKPPEARRGKPWCGKAVRQWQGLALSSVEETMAGGLSAATGSGKTLVLAELAAREPGSVLVTVPTQSLVRQTAAVMEQRCPGEVGTAYQHEWRTGRRIVVACMSSLARLAAERPTFCLWLADEAHRMEGRTLRKVRDLFTCERRAGFTATPYRADGKGLVWWDVLAYRHSVGDAEDQGTIVPLHPVYWEGDGDPDVEKLTAQWLAEAEGPGVITARDIPDARATAERLGVEALYHGVPDREARLERLRTGKTRALVVVNLLSEGDDYPWLRWIILRVPEASRVRLPQRVGRVLRCDDGKTRGVVYDPHKLMINVGLFHDFDKQDAPTGEGREVTRIVELGDHVTGGMPEAQAVEWWERWCAVVLDRMVARGFVPAAAVPRGDARGAEVEPRVAERLAQVLPSAALFPGDLPDHVAWVARRPGLRHGAVVDLCLVLAVVRREGGCPVEVDGG